jgi:membrane-bound serine protease (ClpP class)
VSPRLHLLVWLGIVSFLVACGPALRQVQDPARSGPGQKPEALLVTLHGKLDIPALARCHRALRTADQEGVAWVVFQLQDCGDLGENARDVLSLLDRVQESKIGTVALVTRATAGGAYLAILCDKLFMQKSGHGGLGLMAPTEKPLQELLGLAPEDAERKRLAAFRDEVELRLSHRKTRLSPDAARICLGMADPTQQLVRVTVRESGVEASRVIDSDELKELHRKGTTVLAEVLLPRPVDLDARAAEEIGLSQGTVGSLEEMTTDHLRLPRNSVAELEPNWSEAAVAWLQLLQPVLLVLGFALLVMEVKAPGVGLPGILGTAFLALALLYSYLVGLAEWTEILLFFLGLGALAVEIFLLPGTIIFGAVGFLSIVAALVLSQQSFVIPHSQTEQDILLQNLINLLYLIVSVIVVALVLRKVLPRIPGLRAMFLPPPAAGVALAGGSAVLVDPQHTALLGRTGRALTVLRPAGAMELDGQRLDVVTAGEFVDAGAAVRILEVQGNRIVVEKVDTRGSERGSVGFVLLIALIGLVLLVAEVMLVSFGILLVAAAVLLFTAVFLAFQDSVAFGFVTLIGESIAGPLVLLLAFKALPKTRMGKAMLLDAPKPADVSAGAVDPALAALLGRAGVCVSPLRPAGFARIDGRRIDVVTRGEMLADGTAVKVIEVQGSRVVVAPDNQRAST